MEIYTIGFTKRTASEFFGELRRAGVRRLVDTRLNNTSQLAAFAKRDDLSFFLGEILNAAYEHEPLLAPTNDLLDAYKKKNMTWADYEAGYNALLESRRVHERLDASKFEVPSVLLCSERTATNCHRRLAVDYLASRWTDVHAIHL